MEKEFLSVKDIAQLLDLKEDTIQGWIRRKKLVAYKVGNTYRIKREDLNKFLEERRTTGNPE